MKTCITMTAFIACLVAFAACDAGGLTGTGEPADDPVGAKNATEIRVMTRNVSIGGDIDRVIAAPSMDVVPLLVAQTWQEIVTNDFHVRAAALAQEIKARRPDLVGLQEITTFWIQDPGDMIIGGTEPATTVVFDYLEILLDALEARGLHYTLAGTVTDTQAEMPMVTSPDPTFADVRMADYDAVLVREGVQVDAVAAQNYAYFLPVDFGQSQLHILRGYVAVDVTIGGDPFRFVNTHLEPLSVPELQDLQLAQAAELLGTVGGGTTIVVGDLNTGPGEVTYGFLTSSGLADAWSDLPGEAPGYTCCFYPDLTPGRELATRYDLVLYRNGEGPQIRPTHGVISGRDPIEDFGIYMSDHAGLTVTFAVD